MLPADVLVRQKPATVPKTLRMPQHQWMPQHLRSQKSILDVLDRAASDNHFVAQLTHDGLEALAEYELTWREKAALLSGDIRWIEAHVGKLDARQRKWLECRLQQEMW